MLGVDGMLLKRTLCCFTERMQSLTRQFCHCNLSLKLGFTAPQIRIGAGIPLRLHLSDLLFRFLIFLTSSYDNLHYAFEVQHGSRV